MLMDLDSIPDSIEEFFSPEEFAAMSNYEKKSLGNLRHQYETFRRAGLPVQPPDFMVVNDKPLLKPARSESSDGSDSEWTPPVKKVKKPKANTRYTKLKPQRIIRPVDGLIEKPNKSQSSKPKRKRKSAGESCKDEQPHLYPFRTRTKREISFMCAAFLDDDDFLYCEECNQEYDGDCPVHGSLLHVQDAEVPPTCTNDEYCRQTLPEGLVIKKSKIPKAGLGVFAVKDFPARTRFGPYRGKKETNEEIAREAGYSWLVMKDGQTNHFIDARDPSQSNWMRFVNCARHEDEQCVTAYQHQGDIYYRSHRQIVAGAEILVYYGDSYAKHLGLLAQKSGRLKRPSPGLNGPEAHGLHPKDSYRERLYKCGMCRVGFDQSFHLKRHKGIQTGEKPSKCDVCSASFNRVDKLKMHKRIHTGEKSYKCDVCSVAFTVIGSLNRHKRIHTREKPYKCDVCSVAFTFNGDLKRHKRIHTGEKPYKCDVCSACFTHSCNLNTHTKIHTGEKPYKCDVCSACFTHSCNLNTHKKIHTGEKPYKCDVCSACFTHSCNLSRHKRKHTGEKPYKCDVCSACFTHSCNLNRHKRIHTGEKPYKCDVCSACFTHSCNLNTHKKIHTGEKPYKCDVCSACFTQICNLNTHKRIHTREKPYKCDVCSAEFTQSCHLKTHKRIHTREKPYK